MTKRALFAGAGDDVERIEAALALAERAGVPVTLALTGAAAVGLARARPALAAMVRDAFADGRLRPLLTTVHGGDARLLGAEELADELRLDEEMLQLLFGVAAARRGFAGEADAVALEQAGIDFVLGDGDEPVRIGERLLALPCLGADDARDGVEIVAPDGWAAELTPPWLPRVEQAIDAPPETLAALATLTGWCVDAFGLRRVPGVAAAALVDENWRLERFPARARLPLVRRRGLCADRRAFVAAYELCDVLAVEARVPGLAAHATEPLPQSVWPQLLALAEAHGAGDPMARAATAYEELQQFRFLGGMRWRVMLTALRDAFALLSSRRAVDWSVPVESGRDEPPILRLVEPTAPLN
jgi:hypothetical protein